MMGESGSTSISQIPELEPVHNRWGFLLIITNLIFGVFYFILALWLISYFIFYALLPLFNILMFWGSYRVKSDEIQDVIEKGLTPEINKGLDLLALVGNIILLILLILNGMFVSDDYFITLLYPFLGITMINFETLGSSLALFQISRFEKAKDASEENEV